jgi:hypothetical protein
MITTEDKIRMMRKDSSASFESICLMLGVEPTERLRLRCMDAGCMPDFMKDLMDDTNDFLKGFGKR